MPEPVLPYSPIPHSRKVINTNPIGSWGQIHPTTQKYLVDNHGVAPDGSDYMKQPAKFRDAIARYPLATVKGMNFPSPIDPAKTVGSVNAAGLAGSLAGSLSGGVSALPLMGLAGATAKPTAPGVSIDLNKGTVTRTPPMGKQGTAMNEEQMFKAAFIAKCIEDGLTVDQMAYRVKVALAGAGEGMEKAAAGWWDLAATVGKGLLGVADTTYNVAKTMLEKGTEAGLLTSAVVGAGIPLAYLGGDYFGRRAVGPLAYRAFKPVMPSREEIMKDELASEYERQADMLKKQTEYARRAKERNKGISGVTRY